MLGFVYQQHIRSLTAISLSGEGSNRTYRERRIQRGTSSNPPGGWWEGVVGAAGPCGRVVGQLKVWQKAHRLVLDTYRHARGFPAEERYGLTAHLLKSATSVPSNIAEGCGRTHDTALAHFLGIAAGSASETEYQLLLTISATWRNQSTAPWTPRSTRSSACSTPSSRGCCRRKGHRLSRPTLGAGRQQRTTE